MAEGLALSENWENLIFAFQKAVDALARSLAAGLEGSREQEGDFHHCVLAKKIPITPHMYSI